MKLGILSSPDSWYFRDLSRAAGSRHELVCLPFSTLHADLDHAACHREDSSWTLDEFDALLVRSMPPGTLEQIVFRMDALAQIETRGTTVWNPPRALEAAIDKYLALCRLQRAGFLTPRTWAGQSWEAALSVFEHWDRDVVVKPLFGSEGRGITRLTEEATAWRTFKTLSQLGAVIYLQPFIPHQGYDIRILQIGDQTLAIQRHNPLDWRTNISRGAQAELMECDDQLRHLGRRVAEVIGAPLIGIDLLPAQDGRRYLLEVNAVPGWRALAAVHRTDVSAQVLDYIAQHS